MAGGYRCSLGHTWDPDGATVVACPVCGDTTLIVLAADAEPAVFVLASSSPTGGQDLTQSIATPQLAVVSPDTAPTLAFTPPDTPNNPDTPEPSFSSIVVLLGEQGGSSVSGSSASASSVVPFGHPETSEFAPPMVPGYEILHEVGRGGMGVVYKARQIRLNRLVALKMILSGAHAGPTDRERFRREAEAVAALQNPNIVQIFDIGEANGHPYVALEFVEGGSLAQQLTGEPWAATRAAELIEILARTMQFAHDAGIVHRDLKPGNILMGGKPETRSPKNEKDNTPNSDFVLRALNLMPKVTDFGLAKRLDETLDGGGGATRTGAVMGTPSYIAPEQASGKTHDVGPPADIYALGAILYELLTGRPPFRGETPLDTVLQVLHDDPVPPKRLHPLVPRDLETICLKCLSKQPAKRYTSAVALADDLRRFLNGEPILARPLSAWGRGVKWARRHPSLAVLLTMTVAATVSLVSVLSVAYFRVRDARSAKEHEALTAQRERIRAEELAAEIDNRRQEAVRQAGELKRQAEALKQEAERTRRAAYALQLSQVAILCERDPLRAAALLEDETRCPKDLRDFTWHYLRRLCQRDDRAYPDHGPEDPLRAVAYSPTGTFVASAGAAGTVRLWEPRTGRTWALLTGHTGIVHSVAFSPDGTVIATAGADRTVRLWVLPADILATARKLTTALPWLPPVVAPFVDIPKLPPAITITDAHTVEALCVAFSPDGRTLVSGGRDGLNGRDGMIRWWTLTGWRPSGPDLAALGGPGTAASTLLRATQAPDASPVWSVSEVSAHTGGVLCLAFSQNGKLLASGGEDRMARVWAPDGTKIVRELFPAHADAVRAVAVSPDGQTVATAHNAQAPTIRLFNTQTWRERRLFGHTGSIHALAISDDGQLLASAGFDKTVRLWDTDDGRERGKLVGHTQQVTSVSFAPDRRTIISGSMDGTAVVWQTNTRTHEPEDLLRLSRDPSYKVPAQGVTAVGVGGGATAFIVADDAMRMRIFAADYVPPGRDPPVGPPGPITLTPLPYGMPGLKESGRTTPGLRETGRAAAASPDGRSFVVAIDGGLLVWQPFPLAGLPGRPGTPRGSFTRPVFVRTPAPVHTVAIDPSGRWIATADLDAVRIYDFHRIPVTTDHPIDLKGGEVILATTGARELTFHPKQPWVAVAVGTGVRVANLQGKVLANLPEAHGTKATVEGLAFDRAGGQLATGDASGLIKLWSLDRDGNLKHVRDMPGHTGAACALTFSPDGRTLASGGDDRAVILWDPTTGQERLSLAGHADRILELAFNTDGTALVTISRDGAVKRWRADVRPAPDSGQRLPLTMPGA